MTIEQILNQKIQSLPLEKQKKLLASVELAILEMQELPTAQGGVPIGTIVAYGGLGSGSQRESLASAGWLVCDGRAINREDYSDLFSVIGNAFGGGDSVKTFNLPDLRGRFVRGVDDGTGRDPDAGSRTASGSQGNTGDRVGSLQGDAFKEHSHQIQFNSGHQSKGDDGGRRGKYQDNFGLSTSTVGGNETRPKNIYVNWIIKAQNVS